MYSAFVCQQNISHFQAQLREARPECERAMLRELLAKEEVKFAALRGPPRSLIPSRPKALPMGKFHLRKLTLDAGELRREHFLSEDVAKRIVGISRTMDQAHAIAELMK